MNEYSEEEKIKYCRGFKKCTLPLTDYASKMKIPAGELKQWLKEYKEPPAFGVINLSEVFEESIVKNQKAKCQFFTDTIKIEILENYDKDTLNKLLDLMVVLTKC